MKLLQVNDPSQLRHLNDVNWRLSDIVIVTFGQIQPIQHINPLLPGVAYLYPLKTSENLKIFWYFQGV